MPDDDKKQAAHRALVDRVLSGEGRASAEQRARAFSNDGLSPPLDALIGKVALRSAPHSTRPTGSPTPSASRCSAARPSRQEPSTCSSAVTDSAVP